jgi:hypothetical protein
MIEIKDMALRQAAAEGMDAFIQVFTDAYMQKIGGELTAETMPLLTGEQHSLLAYQIFRDELMDGGFCQLIQNGYGAYIFVNPFAKVMRLWGLGELSKLVYAAKKVYDEYRIDLERERTDEEFMAMYEDYEVFDDLEDEFLEKEELFTTLVASFVDEHMELFATVVE